MTHPVNEEYFDIVDSRDHVVGRAPRREVHARGLLHRAVHVLVFDSQGRVFLQKRSMTKDTSPGCWDSSCSGHVDSGEEYDPASVRELREEIGIDAIPSRWFRLEASARTGWEFVWVYRLDHEGPFELNPEEITAGKWLSPVELTGEIARVPSDYTESFHAVWEMALAKAANPSPGTV